MASQKSGIEIALYCAGTVAQDMQALAQRLFREIAGGVVELAKTGRAGFELDQLSARAFGLVSKNGEKRTAAADLSAAPERFLEA